MKDSIFSPSLSTTVGNYAGRAMGGIVLAVMNMMTRTPVRPSTLRSVPSSAWPATLKVMQSVSSPRRKG